MRDSRLIRRIGQCLTLDPKRGEGPLGIIRNAAVVVSKGKVAWLGADKKIPREYRRMEMIDAKGALVSPGLIDCHTHLLFAGSRSDEFFSRLAGKTYEEIAREGGGIRKTVRATAEASDKELTDGALHRIKQFSRYGVLTIEIKSGYGLFHEEEIRHLRLISKLRKGADVVPTYLAHVIPDERRGKREEHVREICEKTLPLIAKEKLASICDVFCDDSAFTLDETRQILEKAKKLGLQVKLHADQLKNGNSAELAAELGALSADHLEHVSDAGIRALAQKKVVGVLLPGAVFYLGKRTYPPARKLIASGVKVAISTDCNPGTSWSENLPLMMTLAAVELRMTAEEIWPAVTVNAAQAIGFEGRGRIDVGGDGALVIWEAEDYREVISHYGTMALRTLDTESGTH